MQYKIGTVSVTNASNVVTGTNTKFLNNVSVGNTFKISGENVIYQVAIVNSDTQLTLSSNYAGVTASGLQYQITTDFTTNLQLSEVNQGDIDWAFHLTEGNIRKLDTLLSFLSSSPPSPPATATSPGTKGEIRVSDTHLYRCIATNTWRRVALATW